MRKFLFVCTYMLLAMRAFNLQPVQSMQDIIIVTRDTEDNNTKYYPLPAAERAFVYDVVDAFVKGDQSLLSNQRQLSGRYNEKMSSEIAEIKKGETAVEGDALRTLSSHYMLGNKRKAAGRLKALQERNTQFVSNLRFPQSIRPLQEPVLIVFNEMFFGKNVPFPYGYLESELFDLSERLDSAYLHINLLSYKNIPVSLVIDYSLSLDSDDTFRCDDSFGGIADYRMQAMEQYLKDPTCAIPTVSNRCVVINRGQILSTSLKKTYWNEVNSFVSPMSNQPFGLYRFGLYGETFLPITPKNIVHALLERTLLHPRFFSVLKKQFHDSKKR